MLECKLYQKQVQITYQMKTNRMNFISKTFKNRKYLIAKYGKYLFIMMITSIIFMIFKQYLYYKEICDNKKVTFGIVTHYVRTARGKIMLYEYVINNIKYRGEVSTNTFRGHNNKILCLGCKFVVYYSSKDPSKSRIYLGEYEKFKRTSEFGLFDE